MMDEDDLLAQYRSGRRSFDHVSIRHDWPFRHGGFPTIDDPVPAKLPHADLNGTRFRHTDFASADLRGANLAKTDFAFSNLRLTRLTNAILRDARLWATDFTAADLSGADLRGAVLTEAILAACCRGTDFRGADLTGARCGASILSKGETNDGRTTRPTIYLQSVDLTDADFSDSIIGATIFLGVDLSRCGFLDRAKHVERSKLDLETLRATADGLAKDPSPRKAVETFLRASGVEEVMIGYFRNLISTPVEFYPCFISYSHTDKKFAQRLYEALQQHGVRCWLDAHNIAPGERILDAVDRAILSHDKVLLCCSKAALSSSWVDDEIAMTFEKERKNQITTLIPLNLDDYLFQGWRSGKGARVRERLAANFVGWENDDQIFLRGMEKLVNALRRIQGMRENG